MGGLRENVDDGIGVKEGAKEVRITSIVYLNKSQSSSNSNKSHTSSEAENRDDYAEI